MKLLYIDLFCGTGGTSTGVENARYNGRQCAKVIGCVNHDANAIASHAANHPDAMHFTEDIRTLELSPLIAHIAKMRKLYPDAFVVLWASLECTNFSKAKGGQPRDADSRTLADHLFRYIEAIIIEPDDSPAMIKIKQFMALYGIIDIKMRMLRIPELKRIMGFPSDYVLVGTQADQKKFIGNAVEVNMARVLCEALCARLIEEGIKPIRAAA